VALLLAGGLALGCDEEAPECSFDPCGGDPVGEWRFEDICYDTGAVTFPGCEGGRVDYSGVTVSGTLRIGQDGTYATQLDVGGTGQLMLPRSCLPAGATCEQLRNEDVSCLTSGGSCRCTARIADRSGSASGSWEVAGSSITFSPVDDDPSGGEFCADGDELLIHFEEEGGIGTYVLRRS
jgi:hypothetical protein